jgi:broad specificity phosphatase PhoE
VSLGRRGYDIAPPNGESLKMVEERVRPFLDELVQRIRRKKIKRPSARFHRDLKRAA